MGDPKEYSPFSDDECFQIIILFLLLSISIKFTQKQKRNPAAKNLQSPILTRK